MRPSSPSSRTSAAARSAPHPRRPPRSSSSSRSPTKTIRPPADSAPHGGWLSQTLEEIVAQLRRAFDLTGCAFVVVDWQQRYIRPAATWFSTPAVAQAFGAVLSRAYDPARPGITEAAIERRAPLLVDSIEDWPGADRLRARLYEQLPDDQARLTWEWYAASCLLSVPVQAPNGRILGVLALSAAAFSEE